MGVIAEARKQECAISEVVHGQSRPVHLVDQVLKPLATREGTAAVGCGGCWDPRGSGLRASPHTFLHSRSRGGPTKLSLYTTRR